MREKYKKIERCNIKKLLGCDKLLFLKKINQQMQIFQKKNKNEITIDWKENGLQYHIKDEVIDKSFFVPFEDISNNTYSFKEQNNSMRNFAIYTLVMGSLFLIINLLYETRFWSWLFMFAAPFFYWRFKRSQISFLVIESEQSPQMYIIKNGMENEIYNNILSARNTYLRAQYAGIDYQNIRASELKKFEWLLYLGVISEREYSFLKDELTT